MCNTAFPPLFPRVHHQTGVFWLDLEIYRRVGKKRLLIWIEVRREEPMAYLDSSPPNLVFLL